MNEETNDIMKIAKLYEDSGILLKTVTETIEHEAKEQKNKFFIWYKMCILYIKLILNNLDLHKVNVDNLQKGKYVYKNLK